MPARLLIAALLAVTLFACSPGTTSPGPASPAASEIAAASTAPSGEPSVAPDPSPTPTPVATPTPTPTPTPEPRQSFTSKEFKYTIKYPADWIATPATPGFTDRFDDGGANVVFIDRDVVDAGGTVDLPGTAKQEVAYHKSHYDAKLLSNKKVKVAGWPGRLLKFTGYDEGLETYFQLLLVAKGRVGYFIEWQSVDDDRKADQAFFERIYKSFKPKS
jgi:PsbP-like protein